MYSFWKNGHILLKNILLKLNFLDGSHLYGNWLFYILTNYHRCLFSALRLWHTYAHLHPNKGSKKMYLQLKHGHILLINVLLKINFEYECIPTSCFSFSLFSLGAFFSILKCWHRHDGHFYAYCLLYIFTICNKCLLFQFLGCGMGMQILILTRVQKKRINSWKNGHHLVKNILFQINFQDEDNL